MLCQLPIHMKLTISQPNSCPKSQFSGDNVSRNRNSHIAWHKNKSKTQSVIHIKSFNTAVATSGVLTTASNGNRLNNCHKKLQAGKFSPPHKVGRSDFNAVL